MPLYSVSTGYPSTSSSSFRASSNQLTLYLFECLSHATHQRSTGEETSVVDYYFMKRSASADLPTGVPFLADSIIPARKLLTGAPPCLRFCDRYVTQSWHESDVGIFLIMSELPTTTIAGGGDHGVGNVVRLWTANRCFQYTPYHAPRPSTGRLCVVRHVGRPPGDLHYRFSCTTLNDPIA
ncbi:hypothetical protein LshimejAT787_0202080 [Lyophyllum shimeji]|uniref:Uncharacterized protein n=1 Tax=Lyophyllum shimeji TaxID=47721 RepID=A0A9P3UIN2_LYOSH|nr:hypothetical protein LshimejAT787_0202080 [Lyophyllum shimeji]